MVIIAMLAKSLEGDFQGFVYNLELNPSRSAPAIIFINNSFFLAPTEDKPTTSKLTNLGIIGKVSANWHNLGTRLEISVNDLDGYKSKSQNGNDVCCTRVFEHWINNDGSKEYPLSWQSVCDILCAIEHRGTAKELKISLANVGVCVNVQ